MRVKDTKRWLLALVALLVAAVLSGCVSAEPVAAPPETAPSVSSSAPSTPAVVPEPSSSATPAAPAKPKPAQKPAPSPVRLTSGTVVRVVDGDTAVVRLRDKTEKVRFIGVDTPESTIEHEPYGKEASRYTKSRLEGKTVFLQVGPEPRDRYGRLLAYVWLQRPTSLNDKQLRAKLFNAQLLLNGYAQLLTIPPNVDYVDSFRRFQTEARSENRGLWGLPAASQESPRKPSRGTYVGSARSNKFHIQSCQWAKKISPDNLVTFASRSDAQKRGYVPCKVCDP